MLNKYFSCLLMAVVMLLAIPEAAQADYEWTGIKVTCTDAEFKVEGHKLVNQDPTSMIDRLDDVTEIYYDTSSPPITCNFDKNEVTLSYKKIVGRAKGECGAAPTIKLSIWVNDTHVIKDAVFFHDCWPSVQELSIEEIKKKSWVEEKKKTETKAELNRMNLKICANTGHLGKYSTGYISSGCTTFFITEDLLKTFPIEALKSFNIFQSSVGGE